MAQLLDWLALAGARDADGDPVSSGSAWFYEVGGGTTSATVYADVDGTIIAASPVALDAGGRATVYVTSPVRVVIQDSTGADVSDLDQADVHRAEAVQVDNAGWSDSYLDGVLTRIYTSTGGVNATYMESSGATARTIKAKFAELSISVKDFGAKGDGLNIDTTAIQAAINRAGFLGGGEVYFPPGTYLIDQVLTIPNDGVSLRGAAATLQNQNSGHDMFDVTHASALTITGLRITALAASTGTAFRFTDCSQIKLTGSFISGHQVGVSFTTASFSSTQVVLDGNVIICPGTSASERGVSATNVAGLTVTASFVGGLASATAACFEFLGSTSSVSVTSCVVDGAGTADGAKFNSALTGTGFRFAANNFSTLNAFVFAGATMPKGFSQSGNGVDGYIGVLLTGATFTPDLSKGPNITINCTTTGSATTVAVPTPPPSAVDYGVYMTITYWAHAGGNLTGGSVLAAGYHVSTQPTLTDTHKTTFILRWDPDNSVWREASRSDTT